MRDGEREKEGEKEREREMKIERKRQLSAGFLSWSDTFVFAS